MSEAPLHLALGQSEHARTLPGFAAGGASTSDMPDFKPRRRTSQLAAVTTPRPPRLSPDDRRIAFQRRVEQQMRDAESGCLRASSDAIPMSRTS